MSSTLHGKFAMKTWMVIPILLLLNLGCPKTGGPAQPISYNHRIHVKDAGIACADCHSRAAEHQRASIPNIEFCESCHADPITKSKEEAKLVNYIKNKQAVPWVQIHRVPDYVYFSHRRHVTLAQIACQECHGDVGAMEQPFARPKVALKMAFCIRCHEKKHVSTDCTTCHH